MFPDQQMKEQILKSNGMLTPISMLTHHCSTEREDNWPNSKRLTEIKETKVKTFVNGVAGSQSETVWPHPVRVADD